MAEKETDRGNTNSIQGASKLEFRGLEFSHLDNTPKRVCQLKNLPLTQAPLFGSKSYEMTATGAPIISASQAFLKSPNWSEYAPGRLYFQKPFGKGRFIEFYILNKQADQPESIASQAEDEILDRYGVMAARLHIVFASYAARQAEPWKEPFVLRGSELIETLQVYKTKQLTKSQKLKAIAELALVVGTLGTVIHWYEGNLNLCIKERTLLWIVSVQEYNQLNLLGLPEETLEVIITVQPGLWTRKFLNVEGEKKRTALHQYSFIPKQFFDLDPHRQKLATSLALYIIQNSRAHKSGVYTISKLLNSVLPQSQIEQAVNDYRYGWKLKEKVDEALLILKDQVGFNIDFDDERYPVWLRPLWAMPSKLSCLPTSKRNQCLLGMKKFPNNYIQNYFLPALLKFSVPLEIQKDLERAKSSQSHKVKKLSQKHPQITSEDTEISALERANITPSALLPETKSSRSPITELSSSEKLTGAIVKLARIAIGMNQRQLAKAIGMSQSWVRDLEKVNPDKPIHSKHLPKLKEVLGLNYPCP